MVWGSLLILVRMVRLGVKHMSPFYRKGETMGYQVKKRYARNDGSLVWRILYVTHTTNKRLHRNISKSEWPAIGFTASMTYEEAKERAKQLSSQAWLKIQEDKRNIIQRRLKEEDKIICSWLPSQLCERFETEVLKNKVCWGEDNRHYKQLLVYWRTTKRIVKAVNLEPCEWNDSRNLIYAFFKKNKWSVSYAQKVIRVLNLYGKFYGKNLNKFYDEVPKPTGEASAKIHEAFFGKRPQGLTSAPLTWDLLRRAKSNLSPENFNWLYLSLWLGLRPSEINSLKYKIETHNNTTVLAVFQHKLVRLPIDQRWKFIPILFQEQEEAIRIIKTVNYKTPSLSVVKKYINDQTTLRGGRKGFIALMYERGQFPKHVAYRWLGHKNMRTTDNFYTQALQQALEFEHIKIKKAS